MHIHTAVNFNFCVTPCSLFSHQNVGFNLKTICSFDQTNILHIYLRSRIKDVFNKRQKKQVDKKTNVTKTQTNKYITVHYTAALRTKCCFPLKNNYFCNVTQHSFGWKAWTEGELCSLG